MSGAARWARAMGRWLLVLACGVCAAHADSVAYPVSESVKAEFARFDVNRDGVLDDDELALFILQDDPDWNNPVIQKIPGYRQAAYAAAIARGRDAFAFYRLPLPADPSVVGITVESLALYRKDHPLPKGASSPQAGAATAGASPAASDAAGAPSRDAVTIPPSLHLKKSSTSVADEKLPAQFGWTAAKHARPTYTVDAALSYSVAGAGSDVAWEVDPTAEAHTSSAAAASQNTISAKIPVWLVADTHYLSIGPDWERDMKLNTETLGGQLLYTTNASFLHAGIVLPPDATDFPTFLWRPYVGWEAGHAYETGGSAVFARNNTYDRLLGKVHAELWFTPSLELAADYYHRSELTASGRNYDYVEVSPLVLLGKTTEGAKGAKSQFSLGLTYKNGRTAPTFTPIDSLNAWFGVQF